MKVILFSVVAIILGTASVLTAASTTGADNPTAVIVVDVQGDFTTLKSGSLKVTGTDQSFVEKLQKATEALKKKGYLIVATQDWHPRDHVSFYLNHEGKKPFEAIKIGEKTQILWPPHCIQGTPNAELLLDKNLFSSVVKKGQDKRYDSYSGFQDDGGAKTDMDKILKKNGIKEVIVYGIATDYCVKATAIDAAYAGYKVTVIENLCRGVAPDTTAKAVKEMQSKGITVKKDL